MGREPELSFIFPNKPNQIHNPGVVFQSIDLARWLAQPKWAGHRALPQCNRSGEITVYSRHGKPLTLAAKDNWQWLAMLIRLPRPWLLDGELCRDGNMVIWDVAIMGNRILANEPYEKRLKVLKEILPIPYAKGHQKIESIQTLEGKDWPLISKTEKIEGVVWKDKSATDLWGIHSTKDVATQIKYLF